MERCGAKSEVSSVAKRRGPLVLLVTWAKAHAYFQGIANAMSMGTYVSRLQSQCQRVSLKVAEETLKRVPFTPGFAAPP